MENEKHNLTEEEVISLESRWNTKDPDTEETASHQMVQRLKTECKKQNSKRPLQLDLRGISLLHEDLTDLDLSGYDFSYANLNQSNLTGTILSYSKFHRTSLEQVILDECEFIGSDLSYASLNECSAKRCGFGGADLRHAHIINADLSSATLSRSILTNADLRASNLENARLSEADLSGAIFTRSKLLESDLKKSNVKGTNFELADMQGCRLLGIKNFKKAKWIGADIRGLDLRGAYLVRRYIADENYLYEFQTTSRSHRALYLLWWASSDCGRSLLRWFIWLSCVTLIFAAIYTQLDIDYGDHKTIFSPIYFSIVTVTTLGYGDALPASLAGQIFVTLQAITGYMGLGGLLSILGNKMARRAE
ncbi:MAG: pentapeptide repeat-containing protein [Desulfobacteraceae bacterium]|nr:pentapeptide repeat-containing protein [Desulfobacteraceae bacterium]